MMAACSTGCRTEFPSLHPFAASVLVLLKCVLQQFAACPGHAGVSGLADRVSGEVWVASVHCMRLQLCYLHAMLCRKLPVPAGSCIAAGR